MFYAKWRSKILENMACSKYQEKTIAYTKLATKSETIIYKLLVNIGVRAGGGGKGGCSPPKILRNSDFLGSKRKFGQSQFSRRLHVYLIILKTWILTWCRRNNQFTFTRDSGCLAGVMSNLHFYNFLLLGTVLHCTSWNGLFPVVNWLE